MQLSTCYPYVGWVFRHDAMISLLFFFVDFINMCCNVLTFAFKAFRCTLVLHFMQVKFCKYYLLSNWYVVRSLFVTIFKMNMLGLIVILLYWVVLHFLLYSTLWFSQGPHGVYGSRCNSLICIVFLRVGAFGANVYVFLGASALYIKRYNHIFFFLWVAGRFGGFGVDL